MKFLFFLFALPLLAQQGVGICPLEKERALGLWYAAEIRRQAKPVDDRAINAYIQRVGAELVPQPGETPFHFDFQVLAGTDISEPIPLPGGYILVPIRSILAARHENEFIGMFAHAIAHVILRHGTRIAGDSQVVNIASIPLVFMGGWAGSHADTHQSTLVPLVFWN